MSGSLFDTIVEGIRSPDKVFLLLPSGASYTYGDAIALSGRYANVLAGLGVRPGDRVAVQTAKCEECLWLYLACLRAGAVYLPLNTAYTATEVSYFVGDAEPALLVCDPGKRADLDQVASEAGISALETLGPRGSGSMPELAAGQPSEFAPVQRAADDLAAILYTSGTTGRSKGAMITHENLRSNAQVLVETWRFTDTDVLLHALPIYHTHGLFVATNTILLSGASMLFLDRFSSRQVSALLPRATSMMGVPTFYTRLLGDDTFDSGAFAHMRVFISGSAPLSANTHRTFTKRTGHAILERYGMTETNMITSNPYDGQRKPGAVGFALPDVTVRIADLKTGAVLPDGQVGVIEVTGPNVFKGYWRMPEKTAAEFRDDGFFITGDLGFKDEDGYVRISGRDKDLIITGGLNVYPAEIENALDELPEISASAVIGLAHPDFGEGVTAVVVPAPGGGYDETAVLNHLGQILARFKVPKRLIAVDQLPFNAMGKVQKNVLRKTYQNLYSAGSN
jgi:malonyl-CoA/methylmalonyl-CoA synthetase